ncbi:MAG: hypothetical protein RIS64_3605 [Bacteroidota bacterium]|jgi:hypothetical protein
MEIRKEIQDIVSVLPEDVLPKVLEAVQRVRRDSKPTKIYLSVHLPAILETDANLLKRLAQSHLEK